MKSLLTRRGRSTAGSAFTIAAVLFLAASAASAKTFCAMPGLSIPDGGSDFSEIVISDHLAVHDLDLSIKATHTWIGDLVFTLSKEIGDGSPLLGTMIDRPFHPQGPDGCGQDNIDVLLDDEAAADVDDQCEFPFGISGRYRGDELLSAFDGVDMAGTYRLTVSDEVSEDVGTLDEWCLVFQSSLDIDGDGAVQALTDGILILRHRFGFTGAILIDSAVNLMACTRCTETEIEAYLDTMP